MPTQPTSPMDDRYGRRPQASRNRITLLAIVGVALLFAATTIVFAWSRSGTQVSVSVGAYKVVSDAQTSVTFAVDKPNGTPVSCRVIAKDRSGSVVGSQDVTLPAAGSQVSRTVVLRTRGRAVLGTVDSCVVVAG
jgi:uncharacterized protein (DUF58 family)